MKIYILAIFLLLIYEAASSCALNDSNKINCKQLSFYDEQIVSEHNTSACCWVIIFNGVYDMSDVSDRYTCGTDNTQHFYDLHGSYIIPIKDFFIGTVAARDTGTVTLQIVSPPLPTYDKKGVKEFYLKQNIEFMKKIFTWINFL